MTERHAIFRADASVAIGTGHLVRSRALAERLIDRGWRITLATRDLPAGFADGFARAGIAVVSISDATSIESEPRSIVEGVGPRPTLIVADHYGLDAEWYRGMRRLTSGSVLMSIDDLADRELPVDIVLNQNLGATAKAYVSLVPVSARVLAGPAYALLRPEFAAVRARARIRDGRVDRVLVFMGGGDVPDVTTRAVEGVADLGLPIDVVVGAAYPHLEALRATTTDRAAITLHLNTDAMATLMDRADLAIGAGSSASWERCALGLPVILVTMADNQVEVGRSLVEAGAAEAIGWHTTVTAADIERAVRVLCADPHRVAAMSAAAARVTDGRGTERVVDEIEAATSAKAVAG